MLVPQRLFGIVGTELPIFAVSAAMSGHELHLWIHEAASLRLAAKIILVKNTAEDRYSLSGLTDCLT